MLKKDQAEDLPKCLELGSYREQSCYYPVAVHESYWASLVDGQAAALDAMLQDLD